MPLSPRVAALALLALGVCQSVSATDAKLRPWPAGQPTPALKLTDIDGNAWDLAALRGKVVVVNFWASWCAPCVEELPVLGRLAQGKTAVVGVNYMEPRATIGRFTAEHPLPYAVLRDRDGAAFKNWTAGVMPTTIVVDRQGRARWRTVGAIDADDQQLQRAIRALQEE